LPYPVFIPHLPYCTATRCVMSNTTISRRAFVAGATILVSGQAQANDDTDVVIIGAGAAGIAAARELKRLGKRYILIEARDRAGGRLYTDTTLGQPFDAGGAYIHFAERNPWSVIASELGVDAQGGYRLWAGSVAYRNGVAMPPEEQSMRWEAMRKVSEVYDEVEERADLSMTAALRDEEVQIKNVARIQAQMAAGEDPEWISVSDWQRLEGGQNRLVPGGYGMLAVRAAEPLDVRLGVVAQSIDWSGQLVVVTTDKGTIRARKAIITVPLGILKAGRLKFRPTLPLDTVRAIDGLRMGALTKVALKFGADKLGFQPHQFLAEIGDPSRAVTFETWPQNSEVVLAVFGGDYARGVARQGETAAVDHLLERFVAIAGADVRKTFSGGRLSAWSEDAFSLGSYAVAMPGRMRAREALAKPVAEKLWFAGEASAGVYSMTAGGAYLAGRDAAKAAAAKLSTGSLR
jgi:monoamine oxidase